MTGPTSPAAPLSEYWVPDGAGGFRLVMGEDVLGTIGPQGRGWLAAAFREAPGTPDAWEPGEWEAHSVAGPWATVADAARQVERLVFADRSTWRRAA